jgi:SlyX protein
MNGPDETLARRLDEMEVKLTFIDEAVQALTTADADQSQRIAALERALHDLRGEMARTRIAQGDNPHTDPPPPHY